MDWVFIKILNNAWETINEFQANGDISISSQANQHDCDIAIACRSGACLVCSCEIVQWAEYIDHQKFGRQLAVPSKWQILSCISGIKDEYLNKPWRYEIILKKLI